jgi:hypothetical protein
VGDPSSLAKSGVAISSMGCMVPQSFAVSGNLKDRGGNRRGGGGEREPNEILSQETGLCPTFETPNKTTERK